jgi:hypothetical protein
LDAVSANEYRKLPADDASHTEIWVMVSDVPPFVHDGFVPDMALEPADAAAHGIVTRVTEPAAAAVAPAEPGSAVWSFANEPAGAVNAEPEIMSSHLFASVVAAKPVANLITPFSSAEARCLSSLMNDDPELALRAVAYMRYWSERESSD